MADGDPYPKVKKLIISGLAAGLKSFGFQQFESTAYFIRDRSALRDAVFFQKMRSSSICAAYGMSLVPLEGEWSPGIKPSRWLKDQEFFNCRYLDHAQRSVEKIIAAFQVEALPWFERFQAPTDLSSANRF